MREEASTERSFVYKLGLFDRSCHVFLSFVFLLMWLGGIIQKTMSDAVEGFSDFLLLVVVISFLCLPAAVLIFRPVYKNRISSKTVVLYPNKVQRPVTKGNDDGDYLFFDDVLDTKVYDDEDIGSVLKVYTKAKNVKYKGMYFRESEGFNNFCVDFERALTGYHSRKQ